VSRKPPPKRRYNVPTWLSKGRLLWMVIKEMPVEDVVRMAGSKAVDLARDKSTNPAGSTGNDPSKR
jgi:hypothetical protein